MNNADRLLKAIYKDVDLEQLINRLSTYLPYQKQYSLDVDNEEFLLSSANLYTKAYPNNYSAEEVKNLLKIYLGYGKKYSDNPCAYSLFFYCAEKLFYVKNNSMIVRFENLLAWDGFCNKVDANVLISAFAALHSAVKPENVDAVIKHDNYRLDKIMQEGMADNHMHFKASGYSVEMSWAALMVCSFHEDVALNNFIKYSSAVEQGFAKDSQSALLLLKKIKFLRLVLEYCIEFENKGAISVEPKLSKNDIIKVLTSNYDGIFLRKKYSDFIDARLFELERRYSSRDVRKYFIVERRFLTEAFRILLKNSNNSFFAFLFEIYIASITHVRFLLVQDNEGMGFGKFKRRENTKSKLLRLSTNTSRRLIKREEEFRSVFDRYYRSRNVHYVEFRIAPPDSAKEMRDTLKLIEVCNNDVFEKSKAERKIEYGVIIHYIKGENEPDLEDGKYRWQEYRQKLKKQTEQLQNYLERKLYNSEKIVGIDAANFEVECRPEVLAPYFRMHRNAVGAGRNLGITYHVGEEFDVLCSGLRAIDETIEFINLRRGDRLGHAVALGIEIENFRQSKRNSFALPLLNHVDNLAWMYNVISSYGKRGDEGLLGYLESEYKRYVAELYQDVKCGLYADKYDGISLSVSNYIDAWKLRGDSPEIYIDKGLLAKLDKNYRANLLERNYMFNSANLVHYSAFSNKIARSVYIDYLNNEKLFKNGKRLICPDFQDIYWVALECAQSRLRSKIYTKEIAIETNPSSNRKISYVSKFIDLPFLSFNQHFLTEGKRKKCGEDISISINTDDCDIFQSDLPNEYALVVAALQKEKYAIEEIYDYIDYLRNMSITQTFVRRK